MYNIKNQLVFTKKNNLKDTNLKFKIFLKNKYK